MKRWAVIGFVLMGVFPVNLLAQQPIPLEVQGGKQLIVQAKAQDQQWIAYGGRIWLAAIIDGKLVVQEAQITLEPMPPGPQPGPEPKPDPKPEPGPEPTPDPQPEPKPEPQPVKHWQVAFFVESNDLDNLSADQKAMLASLQARKDLEAKGHRLLGVLDPDAAATATDPALRPWLEAAKGKAPCLAIAPLEGGTIRILPLPASAAELWKLLENPPAPKQPTSQPPSCFGGRCWRR